MKNILKVTSALALLACVSCAGQDVAKRAEQATPNDDEGAANASAGPDVQIVETEVMGGFVGGGAPLHPDQRSSSPPEWYGTDLGFSYHHQGDIKFLFGDSWSVESYAPIEASSGPRFDDAFGSVAIETWPDGRAISPDNIPSLVLRTNPGTREVAAIDPGHVMDLGKTPMGGFSTGAEEFGVFNLTKPQACTSDADCGGLSCATELGTLGTPASEEAGLTLPCADGSPFCAADTVAVDNEPDGARPSGLCVDPTSFPQDESVLGKAAASALKVRIGRRDPAEPKRYRDTHDWLTNKFSNVTLRAVQNWPAGSKGVDYRTPDAPDEGSKLFLWGRPGFVGNKAEGRPLGLYFAYVEMPEPGEYEWSPEYFSGLDEAGEPQFSPNQTDAVPLDLDAAEPGYQSEQIDIVNQMSVVWEPTLQKWVMFYGGGLNDAPTAVLPICGVLQLFAGPQCKSVDVGNGAIRMRTADAPWGPWTAPEDVIVGGDPHEEGSGQYVPGGLLRHPDCTAPDCADHSDSSIAYTDEEIGFFYAPNIIEEWSVADEDGVTLTWNVSTWDPYRVALLKTRLSR